MAGALVALVAGAVAVFMGVVAALPSPTPTYGVLDANPTHLVTDYQAGVRLAMVGLAWHRWEPHPGVVDHHYRAKEVATVHRYQAAGYKVAVDIGLQAPPDWVTQRPGGRLVDQFGNRSDTANFEFSQQVRKAASGYIHNVVHALGPVAYYRVGLSGAGEMLYPGAPHNNWWAFGPYAQGQQGGLPPGVPPTPLPGWVPGTTTYHGQHVTQHQVQAWYHWYFGALVAAHAWEITQYRVAGFQGTLQLVMPGTGAQPWWYHKRLAADLANPSYDPYHTMNTGAVWPQFLNDLAAKGELGGVIVDISSVGDGSGSPPNNGCQPGDQSVPITSPQIRDWSDTRWLTYLASAHGLSVMGENPGSTPPGQLSEILHLARSCNLTALQWAWDNQLYGGKYVSVSQLATATRTGFEAKLKRLL
ncbi:MAG TPA: hypothetical protein VE152_12985 [Acidimicrobiales bacterium]|nr:hypothetical protein [Acidimicrobiales bacterium]